MRLGWVQFTSLVPNQSCKLAWAKFEWMFGIEFGLGKYQSKNITVDTNRRIGQSNWILIIYFYLLLILNYIIYYFP